MLALYASAFGSYAPNLITITGDTSIDTHISISAVVIIATIINYASAKLVSAIESYAVIIKLIILLGFIAVGIYGMNSSANLEQLDPSNWKARFKSSLVVWSFLLPMKVLNSLQMPYRT